MKYIVLLLALLSFTTVLIYGQTEDKDTFQDALLRQHNFYRDIAGIPLLKWNKDIEQNAQKWADNLEMNRCKLQHSPRARRSNIGGHPYIGENLYMYGSSAGVNVTPQTGKDAVNAWYSEIGDYQYSADGVVCPKRGKRQAIGHFTQLMWDKSRDLGCAYSVCNGKTVVVVCQYGPGGNVNIATTPPFDETAAQKLDKHPINQQFDGLPRCDR